MFHEASFLAYLSFERRFSDHTLTAYRNDLEQFISYIKEEQCLTSIDEVRHLHIRSWIVRQMQAGQAARSINRRLSCLKTYFKYLKKRGLLEKDPMKKVVAPKSGRRLPVFIQEKELGALFELVPFPDDYTGKLHRLLLEVLYATGMRRGEAAKLRVPDIDLGRGVFRVAGKGNKERLLPITPLLTTLLEEYLALRNATFPGTEKAELFIKANGAPLNPDNIYYIVRKYLSAVSAAEQRSPHVLRHSFATHLSNRGADLNAIKELLGHANLAATQVYMHNSIQRLQEIYEQAHPKGEVDSPKSGSPKSEIDGPKPK